MTMTTTRSRACFRKSSRTITPVKNKSTELLQCAICLDNISYRGKLSICCHYFCFTCIYEWSKKTNRCPLCKQKFRAISKVSLTDSSPARLVRIPDRELVEDEENIEYVGLEPWELSQMLANEYDLDDSFIDNDDLAWLDDSTTSGDSSSDENWSTESSRQNPPNSPAYQLRTRPTSLPSPVHNESDSQSTEVEVSSEGSVDESAAPDASTERVMSSDSEQDKHFRAIRNKRRRQRAHHLLCQDEGDSEMEEKVTRCRRRKAVKPLPASSDSEAGSDVLGFDFQRPLRLTNCFVCVSPLGTNDSWCRSGASSQTGSASQGKRDGSGKRNGDSSEYTLRASCTQRSLSQPSCCRDQQSSSHSQQTYLLGQQTLSSSSATKKRKRKLQQENLSHFFSPSAADLAVADPLTLPLMSAIQNTPSSITVSSNPASKSRVRGLDSNVSSCLSSNEVQSRRPARKLRALQPNSRHNCQVGLERGDTGCNSSNWLSARRGQR